LKVRKLEAFGLKPLLLALAFLPPGGAGADALEDLLNIGGEELRILTAPPKHPPFFHGKALTLTRDSLETGWVNNYQCHRNFSRIPRLEISFREDSVRNLAIVRAETVGAHEVVGSGVKLEDVRPETEICLTGEARVLSRDEAGRYRLLTGPFFYRFLDGYFPVEVELTIRYPAELLTFAASTPAPAPGIDISHDTGELRFRSVFEGRLWVELLFDPGTKK
jgi:hypothetical protein